MLFHSKTQPYIESRAGVVNRRTAGQIHTTRCFQTDPEIFLYTHDHLFLLLLFFFEVWTLIISRLRNERHQGGFLDGQMSLGIQRLRSTTQGTFRFYITGSYAAKAYSDHKAFPTNYYLEALRK